MLATALAAGLGWSRLASGGADAASAKSRPPPLVELVTAQLVDLPHVVEAPGHVVPLDEVEVRPQVEGVVAALRFEEGQDVAAGQLLFVLDAGDALAMVRQAQALYDQTTAELAEARRNYERSRELVASRYVSPSAVDAAESRVQVLQAQQQSARAQIDSSRIREGYTRITAPISGRAGAVSARRGALVRPSDASPLVRIVQLDPIGVDFSLPERELEGLARALRDGDATVSVLTDAGPLKGELVFTDNSIDTTTGTIRLKARFDNPAHALWPGGFVRLRVGAGMRRGAVVLPPQAVLEGPEGHFVYQVDAAGRVQVRPVAFEGIQDGRAVVSGLEAGEAIVAEGHQTIRAGMEVRVRQLAGSGT